MYDENAVDRASEHSRSRITLPACALLLTCALIAVVPAIAAETCEVTVKIKDEKGVPQPDIAVSLLAVDKLGNPLPTQAPFKMKTGKKGEAFSPFLPHNGQGDGKYLIRIDKEGLFIREFKVDSRHRESASDKGVGTVIDDHAGKANLRQPMPPFKTKPGGTAIVELVLAPVSSAESPTPEGMEAMNPAGGGTPGSPGGAADPLVAAKALAAQGKYEEAEAAIKSIIEKSPSDATYEFELARVYHQQEKTGEVKAALLRTLAKDQSFPKAHYMIGMQNYQDGRRDDAIKELEAEIAAHPDDAVARSTLGMVYSEVGRKDDAIKSYEAIVAKDAQNADALVALGALYAGQGNLKKSEETYNRVAAIDPGRADQVYYKVGRAIGDQKDLSDNERQRAVDAFKKAVELNPKNAKAHRDLAYALLGLGKTDEAKGHFKTYLDLTPGASDGATIRDFLKGL